MSFEAIAIGFAILIWVIGGIIRLFQRLGKQMRGTNAPPGPVQQAGPPAAPQTLPQRVPPLVRPPSSSMPAPAPVRYKTSAAAFVSQEEALRAEEVAGRGVPLSSPATPGAAQAAPLFGSRDDLVRAVILQEVLGPPLSRRPSSPAPAIPPPPA